MKMNKRAGQTLRFCLSAEQNGKIDEGLHMIRLNGSEDRLAGLLRTARNSGRKSACC